MKYKGEIRTYTVIPATVQVPRVSMLHNNKVIPDYTMGTKTVVQPLGRQMQQGQHVMGRYMWETADRLARGTVGHPWGPCTGITLMCRDSAELRHVTFLLLKKKIHVTPFEDENEGAYGKGIQVVTAICTEPVYKDQVAGILDYLPLWPGEQK
jgi:hypothetical protein